MPSPLGANKLGPKNKFLDRGDPQNPTLYPVFIPLWTAKKNSIHSPYFIYLLLLGSYSKLSCTVKIAYG